MKLLSKSKNESPNAKSSYNNNYSYLPARRFDEKTNNIKYIDRRKRSIEKVFNATSNITSNFNDNSAVNDTFTAATDTNTTVTNNTFSTKVDDNFVDRLGLISSSKEDVPPHVYDFNSFVSAQTEDSQDIDESEYLDSSETEETVRIPRKAVKITGQTRIKINNENPYKEDPEEFFSKVFTYSFDSKNDKENYSDHESNTKQEENVRGIKGEEAMKNKFFVNPLHDITDDENYDYENFAKQNLRRPYLNPDETHFHSSYSTSSHHPHFPTFRPGSLFPNYEGRYSQIKPRHYNVSPLLESDEYLRTYKHKNRFKNKFKMDRGFKPSFPDFSNYLHLPIGINYYPRPTKDMHINPENKNFAKEEYKSPPNSSIINVQDISWRKPKSNSSSFPKDFQNIEPIRNHNIYIVSPPKSNKGSNRDERKKVNKYIKQSYVRDNKRKVRKGRRKTSKRTTPSRISFPSYANVKAKTHNPRVEQVISKYEPIRGTSFEVKPIRKEINVPETLYYKHHKTNKEKDYKLKTDHNFRHQKGYKGLTLNEKYSGKPFVRTSFFPGRSDEKIIRNQKLNSYKAEVKPVKAIKPLPYKDEYLNPLHYNRHHNFDEDIRSRIKPYKGDDYENKALKSKETYSDYNPGFEDYFYKFNRDQAPYQSFEAYDDIYVPNTRNKNQDHIQFPRLSDEFDDHNSHQFYYKHDDSLESLDYNNFDDLYEFYKAHHLRNKNNRHFYGQPRTRSRPGRYQFKSQKNFMNNNPLDDIKGERIIYNPLEAYDPYYDEMKHYNNYLYRKTKDYQNHHYKEKMKEFFIKNDRNSDIQFGPYLKSSTILDQEESPYDIEMISPDGISLSDELFYDYPPHFLTPPVSPNLTGNNNFENHFHSTNNLPSYADPEEDVQETSSSRDEEDYESEQTYRTSRNKSNVGFHNTNNYPSYKGQEENVQETLSSRDEKDYELGEMYRTYRNKSNVDFHSTSNLPSYEDSEENVQETLKSRYEDYELGEMHRTHRNKSHMESATPSTQFDIENEDQSKNSNFGHLKEKTKLIKLEK